MCEIRNISQHWSLWQNLMIFQLFFTKFLISMILHQFFSNSMIFQASVGTALWSCFREILAASSEIGGRINQSEGRMTIFCHLICLSKFQQARWRMCKGYLGVMGKHRKMLDLHTGNHDAQTRKAPWSFFIWKTFGELWKIVVF
jgi:hypothetical protein